MIQPVIELRGRFQRVLSCRVWRSVAPVLMVVMIAFLQPMVARADENPFGLPAAYDQGRLGSVMLHGKGKACEARCATSSCDWPAAERLAFDGYVLELEDWEFHE